MSKISLSAIKTLDRASALAWLRLQPGGSVTMTKAELARRWGVPREYVPRWLGAWVRAGLVAWNGDTVTLTGGPVIPGPMPPVTPSPAPPAPPVPPSKPPSRHEAEAVIPAVTPAPVAVTATPRPVTPGIDAAAYAASIVLAGVAAWFSIRGMVVLFPGDPRMVIAMAGTMEAAKLVTAAFLAARWRVIPWIGRILLIAGVLGIAAINAAGVYSQLVSAHVGERGAAQAAIETADGTLAAKIEVAAGRVADLDKQIAAIDGAIAEAAKRGRTNTALAAMDGQRQTRANLVRERGTAAEALAAFKADRAGVAARGRQQETEAAPIVYAAQMVGLGGDSEQAIRWLILLMVLCCDPLAITLMAAASAHRGTAA